MTLRGFLLWYVGAVVYVGAAGATGYQALMRQHVQDATNRPDATPPGTSVAVAQARQQPASPTADSTPTATARSAIESPQQRRPAPPRRRVAAATEPPTPLYRPAPSKRRTAEPALHLNKAATERAEASRGRAHLPPVRALTSTQHLSPAYRSAQYAEPRQPGARRPPLPPAHQVTTSAYPGVYAYQPSNAYRAHYAYPAGAPYPGHGAYPTGYPYSGYYAYQPGYAYPGYDAYRNGYAYYAASQQYGRYRAY